MFIAGIAFPSVLLPFLLLIISNFGNPQILTLSFLHFIPIIWGIWNIFYFSFFSKILPGNSTLRVLIMGAILGFLVAIYGVFVARIPELEGFANSWTYLPLIVGPLIYAMLWLFIVNPLNHLLDIYEKQ